jgi:putative N6-adenine-specific DNA methylase
MTSQPTLSPSALRRRIAKHLKASVQEYHASCLPGFEGILEDELKGLPGVSVSGREHGGVGFFGTLNTVYQANLFLRTANLVLLRVGGFLAQTHPMLYSRTRKIRWELHLGYTPYYKLRITTKRSKLNHRRQIQNTVIAGIQARMLKLGLAARYDPTAKIIFHIRIFEDRCTVSLNTSGDHLYRRGYRRGRGRAPVRATTAAAVLANPLTGQPDLIYDPFCGSGTFAFEAALAAGNTPPGFYRPFAFQHTPYYSKALWENLCKHADEENEAFICKVLGSDIDEHAVAAAKETLAMGKVPKRPTFWVANALFTDFQLTRNEAKSPLLVANLPYGNRLTNPSIAKRLIQRFSNHLLASANGWSYAFVTRHAAEFRKSNIPILQTVHFSNGGLPVSLIRGHIK